MDTRSKKRTLARRAQREMKWVIRGGGKRGQ